MSMMAIDGGNIYFEGHGSGPPVIFVHGSGGNHLSWWQQIRTLSKRFCCIIFDQRNYGLSRVSAEGTQSVLVDDILALLDHLEIERAHLVGQSIGARTCLDLAVAHRSRVNRLILAGSLAGIMSAKLSQAAADMNSRPSGLVERALSPEFRQSHMDMAFLYESIEAINHIIEAPPALLAGWTDHTDLTAFQIPTLFIVGAADPVARPELVFMAARMLPRAQFKVVQDAGHSVYFERPQDFNDLVQRFLTSE